MRINTNIAALRTAYQLGRADKAVSNSLAKLSSGNKLINIKDNPVGVSLSVKMKTQIRNLNRASQNTADGISILETAEGGLAEIQSMVHRINELAVQGASEVCTDEDREAIQREMEQIRDEIDRVASDTEFNTKTLFDGNLSRRTYTDSKDAVIKYASSSVEGGEYLFNYTDTASKATETLTLTYPLTRDETIMLNGEGVSLKAGDSLTDAYQKFVEVGDKIGIEVERNTTTNEIKFTNENYGSRYNVTLKISDALANDLQTGTVITDSGTDGTVDSVTVADKGFSNNTSWTVDGTTIIFKDEGSFEMKVKMAAGITTGANSPYTAGVANVGPMVIQVGANEYQEIDIEIPRVDSETLGLDDIRMYTASGCSNAITVAQNAIARISEVRSMIGAYQNRMEHTVATLDATEENMTASLSRIADVDMAEEMTTYTSQNVMSQAATSMLAQANQLPDKVLQLLQ